MKEEGNHEGNITFKREHLTSLQSFEWETGRGFLPSIEPQNNEFREHHGILHGNAQTVRQFRQIFGFEAKNEVPVLASLHYCGSQYPTTPIEQRARRIRPHSDVSKTKLHQEGEDTGGHLYFLPFWHLAICIKVLFLLGTPVNFEIFKIFAWQFGKEDVQRKRTRRVSDFTNVAKTRAIIASTAL